MTGDPTVQKHDKIVTRCGIWQCEFLLQVNEVYLFRQVTIAFAVNVLSNTNSPLFISQRIRYNDLFVRHGPIRTIGIANPSDWMQDALTISDIIDIIKTTIPVVFTQAITFLKKLVLIRIFVIHSRKLTLSYLW